MNFFQLPWQLASSRTKLGHGIFIVEHYTWDQKEETDLFDLHYSKTNTVEYRKYEIVGEDVI